MVCLDMREIPRFYSFFFGFLGLVFFLSFFLGSGKRKDDASGDQGEREREKGGWVSHQRIKVPS